MSDHVESSFTCTYMAREVFYGSIRTNDELSVPAGTLLRKSSQLGENSHLCYNT
jgi:hypothetical protein